MKRRWAAYLKTKLRVTTVKIQNLKSMEAQTEKIQEIFNKRFKEETEMNNTKPKMKNTLEGMIRKIVAFPMLLLITLCLIFISLITMCHGTFLLGFILHGTLCTS